MDYSLETNQMLFKDILMLLLKIIKRQSDSEDNCKLIALCRKYVFSLNVRLFNYVYFTMLVCHFPIKRVEKQTLKT